MKNTDFVAFDLAICGIGQLPSKVEVELIVGVDGKIIDSDAIFADWSGWGGMSIFSALLFVGNSRLRLVSSISTSLFPTGVTWKYVI